MNSFLRIIFNHREKVLIVEIILVFLDFINRIMGYLSFNGFMNSEIMKLIKNMIDTKSNAVFIAFLTVLLTIVYKVKFSFPFKTLNVVVVFFFS